MNTKEYIESGIIETCVLGLASETEYREFQALCSRHFEIAEARRAFELTLEEQLMKKAITPPSYLKQQILGSLKTPGQDETDGKIPKYHAPVRSMNVWKLVAAAYVLILAGTVYWVYHIDRKYQKLISDTIEIANQRDHSSHLDAIIALKSIVQRPSVKWSIMVEPANESHCMAHIYWDSVSKNTFLLLNAIPKPLSGKQFQLWALLNDQPVNLGIFDIQKEGQLIQMKDIHAANAFYITIEPRGGSIIPNMKATYAVGQL